VREPASAKPMARQALALPARLVLTA